MPFDAVPMTAPADRRRSRSSHRATVSASGACLLALHQQLVERIDIGIGRRHQRIGIGALPVTVLAVFLQPHLTSAWASVPSVTAWTWNSCSVAVCGKSSRMALKIASTGPSPVGRGGLALAVDLELELGASAGPWSRRSTCSETNLMRSWPRMNLVVDQRDDVLVEDVLLLVGQVLEAAEGVFEGVVAQLDSPVPSACPEGVAARKLAQHQGGFADADRSSGVMIS